MAVVERRPQPVGGGVLEPGRLDRHLDLERLTHVAEVGAVRERARDHRGRLLGEPAPGPRRQLGALRGQQLAGRRRQAAVERLDVVALDVGGHRPLGAEGAGRRRHDHPRDVELLGQEARLDGAGAAEGDQGEVARVEAVAGQHVGERRVHVGGGDLDDRLGRGVDVEAEGLAERPQCRRRPVRVEAQPAADEVLRVQEAAHQEGVGESGLGAAAAVAGGSGIGAGAPRPDLQHADGVEPGDRAAPRPDRRDADDRHHDGEVARPSRRSSTPAGRRGRGRCRRWCRPCRT